MRVVDKIKKDKFLWIIFMAYFLINLLLVILHEPWRDEIHAWLMAKDYSLLELIKESKFDGHPILWHLILMPFAKLNFPIITLNLISFILVSIAAYLFLFKTKITNFLKLIAVFTIPFTYTYTAIARNYSLIILLLVIIGLMYDKRHSKPILYSILISLLIHTHALSWGIVAGLTITFHFSEIINYFKKKNNADIRKVLCGFLLIVINAILVVLELYGNSNPNYAVWNNEYVNRCIVIMVVIVALIFLMTIVNKSNFREFLILFMSFLFQIIIYKYVYTSILYQRYILIFVLPLFYIILVSKTTNNESYLFQNYLMCTIFILFSIFTFSSSVFSDIFRPYSGAQSMAEYINDNIKDTDIIYIDASIIGQSMIPYLKNVKLYDIVCNEYVTTANVAYEYEKVYDKLVNISDEYNSKYLIVSNNIVDLPYEKLYETKNAIINEDFTLYYIK